MVISEGISGSIADGLEPEPASADRSLSDLNHAAEELSDEFKNVGLDEVAKEQSGSMMIVSESNGGLEDSKSVDGDGDNGGSESESENKVEKRGFVYPVRPGAEDCSFYMRTGSCKFGSSCKFNHPLPVKIQVTFTSNTLFCS